MLSILAQKLLDSILQVEPSNFFGLTYRLLKKLRTLLSHITDPLVVYDLDGTELLIPFSHNLPLHRDKYHQYSKNLGRIAKEVLSKYEDSGIVDIGANIGDTVAILRSQTHCPILCIDGDDQFFKILQKNTARTEDIYIEHAFIYSATEEVAGNLISDRGTARLVQTNTHKSLQARVLSEVLAAHPEFPTPKLVKIDTDGLDPYIVQSEIDLFARLKPVIFLEYDPHLFNQHGDSGFDLFEKLQDIGYAYAVVYENTGEYLASVDLSNKRLLADIHHLYSGRNGVRYSDIGMFHKQDADIFHAVRQRELAL